MTRDFFKPPCEGLCYLPGGYSIYTGGSKESDPIDKIFNTYMYIYIYICIFAHKPTIYIYMIYVFISAIFRILLYIYPP